MESTLNLNHLAGFILIDSRKRFIQASIDLFFVIQTSSSSANNSPEDNIVANSSFKLASAE